MKQSPELQKLLSDLYEDVDEKADIVAPKPQNRESTDRDRLLHISLALITKCCSRYSGVLLDKVRRIQGHGLAHHLRRGRRVGHHARDEGEGRGTQRCPLQSGDPGTEAEGLQPQT